MNRFANLEQGTYCDRKTTKLLEPLPEPERKEVTVKKVHVIATGFLLFGELLEKDTERTYLMIEIV